MKNIQGNWLPEENLLSFLLLLSRLISYDFAPIDWAAIQHGIHDTSVDNDIWFSYILPGAVEIELRLAIEDGAGLFSFELGLPENLETNFTFMVTTLQEFTLIPRTVKLFNN
jgi:hypothetical protein